MMGDWEERTSKLKSSIMSRLKFFAYCGTLIAGQGRVSVVSLILLISLMRAGYYAVEQHIFSSTFITFQPVFLFSNEFLDEKNSAI